MSDPYVRLLESRIAALERSLARLARQLRAPIALSRSTANAQDSGAVQTNQGRLDALSLKDGLPTLYAYGFSSSLPVGGDKLVAFLGGDRSQGVVIATGHQDYRLRGLLPGEAAMHDMWSHSIRLTATGIAIAGDVTVTGSITATGGITAGQGGADPVTVQHHRHPALNTEPTPGT
jgi:phage gp45-like